MRFESSFVVGGGPMPGSRRDLRRRSQDIRRDLITKRRDAMKLVNWTLSGFAICGSLTTIAVGLVEGIAESSANVFLIVNAGASFWTVGSTLLLFAIMLSVQVAWVFIARANWKFDHSWRLMSLGLTGLTVSISLIAQVVIAGIGMSGKAVGVFLFVIIWIMLGVSLGLPLARLIVPGLAPGTFARHS